MAFSQFNQTVTGLRYAPGTFVKGRWINGASTPIEFQASVQPYNMTPHGRELDPLPEGRKELEMYSLYTTFALQIAIQDSSIQSDEVTLFGKSFEVIKVENWQNKVIPHYKAVVSLKKR